MSIAIHDEPVTTAARPDLLGWGTVRAGLGVSFCGTLLATLCPILLVVISWTLQEKKPQTALQHVLLVCSALGWFAGVVLFIAGSSMGSAAPAESSARGWSMAVCFLGPLSVVILAVMSQAGVVELSRMAAEKNQAYLEAVLALRPDDEGAKAELAKLPEPTKGQGELKAIAMIFEGTCLLTLLCHLLALRATTMSFHRNGLGVAVACFLMCSIMWLVSVNVLILQNEGSEDRLKLAGIVAVGGLFFLQLWYLALAAMVRRAITEGLQHS